MAIPSMEELKMFIEELAQLRDEVKLKLHLGNKEVQDEWHMAEEKWKKFSHDADLEKSGEGVKTALQILGSELKDAYQRINKAL